jgi:hypothetical protein|tara:strand:- start:5534 stop:5710 length:177 start_codon:yes stop_codon:yes gene_type:complete
MPRDPTADLFAAVKGVPAFARQFLFKWGFLTFLFAGLAAWLTWKRHQVQNHTETILNS